MLLSSSHLSVKVELAGVHRLDHQLEVVFVVSSDGFQNVFGLLEGQEFLVLVKLPG